MNNVVYLEISVLNYTLNDGKVEMVVDAYNEEDDLIGSAQEMILRNYWQSFGSLSSDPHLQQNIFNLMKKFPTCTRHPRCGFDIKYYDNQQWFEVMSQPRGSAGVLRFIHEETRYTRELRQLSPPRGNSRHHTRQPTTTQHGRQTPPNIKSNLYCIK